MPLRIVCQSCHIDFLTGTVNGTVCKQTDIAEALHTGLGEKHRLQREGCQSAVRAVAQMKKYIVARPLPHCELSHATLVGQRLFQQMQSVFSLLQIAGLHALQRSATERIHHHLTENAVWESHRETANGTDTEKGNLRFNLLTKTGRSLRLHDQSIAAITGCLPTDGIGIFRYGILFAERVCKGMNAFSLTINLTENVFLRLVKRHGQTIQGETDRSEVTHP